MKPKATETVVHVFRTGITNCVLAPFAKKGYLDTLHHLMTASLFLKVSSLSFSALITMFFARLSVLALLSLRALGASAKVDVGQWHGHTHLAS